jgi:hypothetical protein
VSRYLAINIEGKIGQLTVRRTSSFNKATVYFNSFIMTKNNPIAG